MGLDVQLHASGNWTDEQVKHAEQLLNDRLPGFLVQPNATTPGQLVIRDFGVDAITATRYYGPGYERGYWPNIYAAIRIMQACFPSCTIHYGSDAADPENIEPVTDYGLELLWLHFLSPRGNAYHGSSI